MIAEVVCPCAGACGARAVARAHVRVRACACGVGWWACVRVRASVRAGFSARVRVRACALLALGAVADEASEGVRACVHDTRARARALLSAWSRMEQVL